jgi:hypothetical protein
MTLFTRAFWASIAWALARTLAAGLVPFIPGLVADPAGTWQVATLTIALLLIVTVATKWKNIPDEAGVSWWVVALTRALRQFGQMVVAAAVGAQLVTDVDWAHVVGAALVSALTTLILASIDAMPALTEAPVVDGVAQITTLSARERDALTTVHSLLAESASIAGESDPGADALAKVLGLPGSASTDSRQG